jgi:putative transposase
MKKSRFTEVQVVQALQKHESGVATGVICREMGIAPATFYNWKAKYGGLDVSDVQKLKTVEEEHSRLKRMYADLAMDNQLLRYLFSKKAGPCHQAANSRRIGTRSRRTGEQGLHTGFQTHYKDPRKRYHLAGQAFCYPNRQRP